MSISSSSSQQDLLRIPRDISAVLVKLDQLALAKGKSLAEIEEGKETVCSLALQILTSPSDPASRGEVFTALQHSLRQFELSLDQKWRLYSALAKTPLSHAQADQLDKRDINFEEFSDTYTLEFKDGSMRISGAELSTLGKFFTFVNGFSEAASKKIVLNDLEVQQFVYFRKYMSGACPYDLSCPDIWWAVKTLAERFIPQDARALKSLVDSLILRNSGAVTTLTDHIMLLDLGKDFPPYPRFKSVDDAVQFVLDHHLSKLDLSQFGNEISDSNIDAIGSLIERNDALLSHLKKLVVDSRLTTTAGLSRLPANIIKQNLCSHSVTPEQWADPAAFLAKLPPKPKTLEDFLAGDCPIYGPGTKASTTHFVVPLIKNITTVEDGVPVTKPRTLKTLNELDKASGGTGCRYIWDEILKPEVDKLSEVEFEWAVMTKDVLPGSKNQSYDTQKRLAEDKGYLVPGILDAATCILWAQCYLKIRLYSENPRTYTRCREVLEGHHLVVGGFAPGGLFVHYAYDGEVIGVAGLRKF